MKWLVYVYPKKWREQYGEELEYILKMRKPSIKDVLNILYYAFLERLLVGKDMVGTFTNAMLYYIRESFTLFLSIIMVSMLAGSAISKIPFPMIELSMEWVIMLGVFSVVYLLYTTGLLKFVMLFRDHKQREENP
ncbi:hypothetical protein [Oceanobacillus kapialis]|uniref:Uncharacterized protein n=1 Tax=Oceanobacillus kapialis TaxID=481353 RepID=A0ABW5PX03_9BACI